MIPEQSETEKNRVEIATMQGLFSICGTVIGAALPIYLESFLQNPTQAYWGTTSGQFLTTIVPIIGLGFVILALVCILITYFTLDESFLKDQQPTEKETLKSVVNQMVFPLKNANTRWFLGIIFGFNMAMRALITVVLPLITIVLLLKGTEIVIFIVVLAPFALVGFFFLVLDDNKNWFKKMLFHHSFDNHVITFCFVGASGPDSTFSVENWRGNFNRHCIGLSCWGLFISKSFNEQYH